MSAQSHHRPSSAQHPGLLIHRPLGKHGVWLAWLSSAHRFRTEASSIACHDLSGPSMAKSTRSFPASIGHWYDRLASYNVADLFTRKRAPGPPRTVYLNEPLPPSNFDRKGKIRRDLIFTSNQIITSKYSLITFLPRNLLEQFRRVANMCVHRCRALP